MTKNNFLKLSSPVQYIKGVGPKRALYLKRLGIEFLQDLLYAVPRRYIDYSAMTRIKDTRINDEITCSGAVCRVFVQRARFRGNIVNVVIADGTGALVLKWFNRPDLIRKFQVGDRIVVSGKVTYYRERQLINPLYELLGGNGAAEKITGSIIAVYPLTDGLNLWTVRRLVKIAVAACRGEITETLPDYLRSKNGLPILSRAINDLHFPNRLDDAVAARRRLVYDEFFYFELVLARRRAGIRAQTGVALKETNHLTGKLLSVLPFQLTPKQRHVIGQIAADMEKSKPMNRLLQGDVGAGKTIVALYAMLIAVENGCQAVLMAPTEILAEQHFFAHQALLERLGVTAVLLTGSLAPPVRKRAQKMIADGAAGIAIGTHALIEEGVAFNRLGLVVVDEQHRFGVMQRAALVNKGVSPDFLVLSATPIPRTLALTLYGDLDVSTLDEKPAGRAEVVTRIAGESEKEAVYRFVAGRIGAGRQMFVICPAIGESESGELKSVKEAFEEMARVFPDFTAAVIHGRLKTEERLGIMNRFRDGAIDILVATTVIEVGIDIPNATLMIIEHPERFGLAQLHQLRGRIGRGKEESFCFLFMRKYVGAEAYERISFFSRNRDGFELAKKDMKLRGPGEILGRKQHGLPDIKIGDIEEDREVLVRARDDAFDLIRRDPEVQMNEHSEIRRRLQKIAEGGSLLRIG